jgi:hypothetical protein
MCVDKQDLWFFVKDITLIKTQNSKEGQVIRQQTINAEACVHFQVFGVYCGWVAMGEICPSTSVICCQYQSPTAPQSFTCLSPTTNNL